MPVNHYVDAGTRTYALSKSDKCTEPLIHLSSPLISVSNYLNMCVCVCGGQKGESDPLELELCAAWHGAGS